MSRAAFPHLRAPGPRHGAADPQPRRLGVGRLCPGRLRAGRLAALAALAACCLGAPPVQALTLPWQHEAPPPPAPPRPVVTEIVADAATYESAVPGVIAAENEVNMAFQTLGRLVERPVQVGERVSAGELLARLDPNDLESTVSAAQAAVDAAEVNLRTAQAAANRVRALASRNVASKAQLERAEQALATAQATVAQSRSQLVSARDAQGFAEMTAPFDGIVDKVLANPGAVVAAGEPVLTLSGQTDWHAEIDLSEAQLDGVSPGTRYRVTSAEGGEAVGGVVVRIDPVADAATRTRRVHIKLDTIDGLRLGSLVQATRDAQGAPHLSVPAEALIPGGPPAVWVVTRQGDAATVTRRAVEAGAVSGGRVPVTAGLSIGDEVVIRGAGSLQQNQPVGRRIDP